jgi:hypothetical protein
MTPEEKLELSRNKNLFVVTHRLEPIVRVELRKTSINEPMQFGSKTVAEKQEPVIPAEEPAPAGKVRTPRKK